MNPIVAHKRCKTTKILKQCEKDPENYVTYYKRIRRLWWFEYKMFVRPKVEKLMTEQGHMIHGHSSHLGACHYIWDAEKTIMKDRYGIEWYSLSDINPGVLYD